MQYSVVNYKTVKENSDFRIDGEFYHPIILNRLNLLDLKQNDLLGNLAKFVVGPFGSTVTVDKYVDESEYRYVRNKDINDFIIGDDNIALISDNFYNEESGIPYIRGADFSSGFLDDDKLVYIDNSFKPNNESRVKKGDIVFALIGTVGSMALVDEKFDGAFISNNLWKITTQNYNSRVLQVLFHSICR